MSIRVGINGFGRIGRNVLRAALDDESIEFAAVNDITDPGTLAHLLQYDSVLGNLSEPVSVEGNRMQVGRRSFAVLSERDPGALPWRDLGVDVVVESTGLFTKRDDAGKHLAAGAKRVIITAPAKGPDLTLVLGVNDDSYDPAAHRIISNASCTTNCLAPVAKVLHDSFGFRRGWMTTVHAYTNDQRLLDLPHKDLRRARAAAVSMIPTTTGAAAAVGQVLPALQGRLDGIAMRVPTPNVSVVDLVAEVERPASAGDGECSVCGGSRRAPQRHPATLHQAARFHRLPGQSALVDRGCGLHARDGRQPGQDPLVVRQRVGLFVALRRPHQDSGLEGALASRQPSRWASPRFGSSIWRAGAF